MNTATVINSIVATLVVVLGGVAIRIGIRRRPTVRRAVDSYDGPDQLRLLVETDAHLDAYVLNDPELCARFQPDSASSLDRLRNAVRDEHNEGDQ